MSNFENHGVKGIDVNEFIPDWERWKLPFGMLKATEGTDFQNPSFGASWEAMKKAGMIRFAYHFGHPAQDPARQAKYLTDYVREHGLGAEDHFALDFEVTDGITDPVKLSFWANVFCREVNGLNPGHRVMVYTFPWFAQQGYCATLGSWGLWIANTGVPEPEIPPPWRTARFWQYAQGAQVDYDLWNGTEAELREWVAHSG